MHAFQNAAFAIKRANSLLFAAGAGIGVDSGLPDFRANTGFWRAYPPFENLGLSFANPSNPCWFAQDPRLAWGFYGHRLNLYRAMVPRVDFQILKRWSESKPAQVFTSNVDGTSEKRASAMSRKFMARFCICSAPSRARMRFGMRHFETSKSIQRAFAHWALCPNVLTAVR